MDDHGLPCWDDPATDPSWRQPTETTDSTFAKREGDYFVYAKHEQGTLFLKALTR